MSVILCDESGTPIINSQGKITTVDGTTRALQNIYNAISTYQGSEILFPEYGINMETISLLKGVPGKSMIIQSMLSDALDPNRLTSIKSIDGINVNVIGQIAYVDIQFTTVENETLEESVSFNVNRS